MKKIICIVLAFLMLSSSAFAAKRPIEYFDVTLNENGLLPSQSDVNVSE